MTEFFSSDFNHNNLTSEDLKKAAFGTPGDGLKQKSALSQKEMPSYTEAAKRYKDSGDADFDILKNAKGFEAITDPDAALMKLGEEVVKDAEYILHPQNSEAYIAMEGHHFETPIEEAGPEATAAETIDAYRGHQASINSDQGLGTHTLSWEGRMEMEVNNNGQVVRNFTE